MSDVRVSVIIPVYNGEAHIERAVESVRAQTFAAYEVLIVDDGSRDRSLEVARACAARDPDRVRVLQHPGGVNRGVAAARNLAARDARGEFLAFLDADDAWLPGKLEQQVAFLDRHPELGLSITRATIVREGAGHRFIPGKEVLGDRPASRPRTVLIQVMSCQLNFVFSTVMVRTAHFREAGGFIEDLPYQSEDRILVCMVVARHGMGRVPANLCHYLAHGESYTAGVLRKGLAGAIFVDLETRIILWLRRQQYDAWARHIAWRVWPDALAWAATGSWRPAVLARVASNTLAVLRHYPCLLPRLPVHLLRHSRVGPLLGLKRRTGRRRPSEADADAAE